MYPGCLEEGLAHFESMFNQFRTKIEQRIFVANTEHRQFFSSRECAFWKIFVLLQKMRLPSTLKQIEQTTLDFYGDVLTKNEAHNIARVYAIPLFKENQIDEKEGVVFRKLLEEIRTHGLAVGVAEKGEFITSDYPVMLVPDNRKQSFGTILFPLSSKLLLKILPDRGGVSQVYSACYQEVDEVNRMMIIQAEREIYLNHRMKKDEITVARNIAMRRPSMRQDM